MKNILLGLFLILSLQSFAQGEFRGMSWGSTSSELKSNYSSDTHWESETAGKTKYFAIDDSVGGLKVKVTYYFIDDKLKAGGYVFNESHTSDNMYYDDFISISAILNKKYDMEMNKSWNNTTWENTPNEIGYALKRGHVEISETYEDELTSIIHKIASDNNGGIVHALIYADISYIETMKASQLDDF